MGVFPGNPPRAFRATAMAALVRASFFPIPLHAQSAGPVQWTNTVFATPSGSTLQKTGGCGTCSDAGGTSAQSIASGDGYVEFTPVPGARLYAGLGTNSTANTDPAQIDFAFSFWADGGWDVREKNVYRTEGQFVAGDVFRVAIVSGVAKYYKNGVLVYSSLAVPVYPVVLDTTLIGTGATVSNAVSTGTITGPATSAVSVTTTALPEGTISQPYAATLQASGGSGSYSWSIAAGGLAPGLALAANGTISGTPSSSGTFTFTARAADALDPTNFAERTLTLTIGATPPAAAVTIQTSSLPSTRVAASYAVTLVAAGGSGSYRWSVAAGALPAGLALDAVSGAIQGSATASGRFTVTIRASDATDSTAFGERTFTLAVLAEAPPSTYDAITDRTARAKPPLPALSGAGYAFTDPTFGSRMVRITDRGVRPGALDRSYRTPSSTHANAWSADARYFYAVSTDGTVLPFSFDAATMRASRLQPTTTGDGGLTLRFFNEPTFSYVTPGVIYGTYSGSGANLRSVDQYDLETGQYTQLLDLDALAPNLAGTYTGGLGVSAGPTEKLYAFFGGTSQDRHFLLVVFDRNNPSNRHVVDTLASTVDGVPTNVLLNFSIHAANIDRGGRYVAIYPTGVDLQAPRSADPVYIWDTITNIFTPLPLVAARTGGHDAFGFGVRVNQDCCTVSTWDAAQWQFRYLDTPLTTWDLIAPVLLPKEVYLADHPSWHNAQSDRLVPFVDANYRYGTNTVAWRAWDEEVFAVQTDAAGAGATVWRFAHHRSAVADDVDASRISFWYTPRANVSPDGKWALFTSNWEKTLGTDPRGEAGGTYRQDVFMVELRAAAAAPPPAPVPVAVATASLPSGQVGQAYSTSLSATGGSGTYAWSLRAGALPAGLALNTSTGTISGTPSAAGTSTFTVRAADASDPTNFGEATLTITIAPQPTSAVVIVTTTLPDAVRGSSYVAALAASGGQAPFRWSIASGSLPAGLVLDAASGAISGTPTAIGMSSFTVTVVDSSVPASSATRALSIKVRKR